MDTEFFFYNCILEGRQLRLGETGLLPAKEVLRAICNKDFQDNSFNLTDPNNKICYNHEYTKPPKDGMYLMSAMKSEEQSYLRVLIDTRIYPNFVLIEKHDDRLQECSELTRVLEHSINQATYKYGWKAKFRVHNLNVVQYVKEFMGAMSYVDEVVDFRSYVIYEDRTDDIMKMLHLKLDNKVKPQSIMRIVRAAIDAGLISKPDFESFIQEFKKEGKISKSAYKIYTKEKNPLKDDRGYLEYLDQFLILKDKWNEDIGRH